MIYIKTKHQNNLIYEIEVSGHANYAEHGKDIVCAGISCIMYGTYNALVELCQGGFDYKLDEGYFRITTTSQDEKIQLILKIAMIQLETVHTSYAQYIKIKKMEV